MISPSVAFLAWFLLSLYTFRRWPIRISILINFFAGWGLLPSAHFTPEAAIFPYWILGTDLPSPHFFTKATVTGICGLIGILSADRGGLKRFKPRVLDLPMLVWCAAPLLSALGNTQPPLLTLRNELYQCLAWGSPYLAGRLYFDDADSLLLAAKAIVLAGLSYVPACLIEIFTGPQLYAHLYGYEPYRWVGAQRFFGFRPVGLLEDGNQLGIWMASSALIAVWLWRRRLVDSILGVPLSWVSAILFIVTLLCQSAGSIVLLTGLTFFAFARRAALPRVIMTLLLVGMLSAIALRMSNVVSLRALVEHNPVAYETARALKRMRLGTFGWRLAQDERFISTALQEPFFGWSRWDWWRAHSSRPWSLWLLAFGMYGLIGLLALEGLQLLPVARVWRASEAYGSRPSIDLSTGLAAVILMSAFDNLLNGSMVLPFLLVIGGLSARPHDLAITR